jgi:hypothetical protein
MREINKYRYGLTNKETILVAPINEIRRFPKKYRKRE